MLRLLALPFALVFIATLAALMMARTLEVTSPAVGAVEAAAAPDLPPASPAPPSTNGQLDTSVQRGPDGHFRVNATINGQAAMMLVDTGASMVAIPEAMAQRMGIAPPPSAYTATARTANGDGRFAPITLASIRIGSIELTNVQAAVVQGSGLDTPLLGQSFLSRLQEMSVQGDVMRLR
jgi:aspartyl protease family protein